jgi:hypothetical protein
MERIFFPLVIEGIQTYINLEQAQTIEVLSEGEVRISFGRGIPDYFIRGRENVIILLKVLADATVRADDRSYPHK